MDITSRLLSTCRGPFEVVTGAMRDIKFRSWHLTDQRISHFPHSHFHKVPGLGKIGDHYRDIRLFLLRGLQSSVYEML